MPMYCSYTSFTVDGGVVMLERGVTAAVWLAGLAAGAVLLGGGEAKVTGMTRNCWGSHDCCGCRDWWWGSGDCWGVEEEGVGLRGEATPFAALASRT